MISDTDLVETFESRRAKRLAEGWRTYPARNPIASDLHDCRRYMVLRQVAWEVRPTPDAEALETIENGTVAEQPMIDQLRAEGWEVVQQQAQFEIKQPLTPGGPKRMILRGKIDGMLVLPDREMLPFDCKDTSSWTLDSIDTAHDLGGSIWTRKWKRQALAYMLGMEQERFAFVLGHRGARKLIVLRLNDYLDEAERILEVCTWAVAMADELETAGVDVKDVDTALNERGVPYHADFSACRSCWLRDRACFPPDPAQSVAVAIRPELEDLVAEYLTTKMPASRYEKLRKELKARTEGAPTVIAGRFIVEGQVKVRVMKPQPAKPEHRQEHWAFEVRRVGEREAARGDE